MRNETKYGLTVILAMTIFTLALIWAAEEKHDEFRRTDTAWENREVGRRYSKTMATRSKSKKRKALLCDGVGRKNREIGKGGIWLNHKIMPKVEVTE